MSSIGFIGFGSMGSMLLKGLINKSNISPNQIIVTRKNKSKLVEIKEIWPGINITEDVTEVAKKAEIIFICVKPLEFKNVLESVEPFLFPNQHIITIAGSLMIKDIESIINCKITKLIPTVISEIYEGISLICHNDMVTEVDAERIEKIIGCFTDLKLANEADFNAATKFTSCGPGLYSAILDEFVEAGLRYTDSFTKEEISDMVQRTIYGTIKLMIENNMDFSDVIERVATKGGLTEEGVKVAKAELPQVFDDMLNNMAERQKKVMNSIHNQYTKGIDNQ